MQTRNNLECDRYKNSYKIVARQNKNQRYKDRTIKNKEAKERA